MDAAYPGMMSRSLNETLPPFQRPFLVHELIHGAAGRAKGVPRQPERNADSEQGVRAGEPKILIKRQRYDDGEVQEQIRLIMQMVRADGDGLCLADYMPLDRKSTRLNSSH